MNQTKETNRPEARLDIQRTMIERGTFKTSVRNAITQWAQLKRDYQIPEDASVQIEIPGGGDWSGMRVDADELDVVVTWERQTSVE